MLLRGQWQLLHVRLIFRILAGFHLVLGACSHFYNGTWPWMMVIFIPRSFWNAVLLYSVFVRNGTWPWINIIFVPSYVYFDVLLYKWKSPERKGLMALCFFLFVWLAILKVTVRYLLLVNSPVTSMIYFFYFFSNRAKHEGKSPTFLQFVRRIMPLAEHLQQFAPFVCASFVRPQ